MNTTEPLITIGICTYNRSASLQDYSLSSIEKLNYKNYEVIIIDDCSSDDTPKVLSEYQSRLNNLQFFRNDKNRGTPFSRNRILEKAQGEIIIFMDDDVSIFPNCLEEFIKVYTKDPEVMFIWGCIYQCHGSYNRNTPTYGTGSLFSIRKIIAKNFQFDTNIRYFKTFVCEENDFARRVQKQGAKIIKVETVKANHYEAPSQNRPWRGVGGDLNYLYEKMKQDSNSIYHYYFSLVTGVILTIKRFFTKNNSPENAHDYDLKESILIWNHIINLIKGRQFIAVCKCLFYIMIDIPIRAKIKNNVEMQQAKKFAKLAALAIKSS